MSNLYELKACRMNSNCTGRRRTDFNKQKKPDTGDPLHTQEPVTVASFRTWRGWREYVA